MVEGLDDIFKFASFARGVDMNKMLKTMVINTQVNTLRQLRRMIDEQIRILTEQIKTGASDDSLNPFKILGVNMNATKEEVMKAYREKANKAHPDKGGTDKDMVMLNAALEAIRQLRGWK